MAAPVKRIGLGCSLAILNTTSTAYTTLAGLMSIAGPSASGDDVDTTTLDNSTGTTHWKTFQRGQVDPGETQLTLSYSSTETANKMLGGALKMGTVRTWKVTMGSTYETFTGYIKSMGREIGGAANMITRSVTMKITGNPGFPTT